MICLHSLDNQNTSQISMEAEAEVVEVAEVVAVLTIQVISFLYFLLLFKVVVTLCYASDVHAPA